MPTTPEARKEQLLTALERARAAVSFRGWKVTIARLLQAEAEDEVTHATQVKSFSEEFAICNAPSNN